MATLLQIDGSVGGGQILRSSLSLSALTGRPFVIDHIRKRRSRPGLMRQHLAAVQAAAQICGAELIGGELGSTRLEFRPGAVRAGSYAFAISTAGSASLVLQTVLPPLMLADAPSELSFEGGTHNPLAPPFPYLDRVFFPVLERMGVRLERSLLRHGFYPAGGGRFQVRVQPAPRLVPLELLERGALVSLSAEAQVANLPHHIATRELAVVQARLGLAQDDLHLRTPEAHGPGNALLITARHEHATEMIIGFGEHNVRAERVAERACDAMRAYLQADVPVGEHLADQLLVPFALAGAGAFRTLVLSEHARSNLEVIQQFLAVRFELREEAGGNVMVRVVTE
jgi:RNA 3'-terminal phosphate cyclase (ATP)